MATNNIAYTNFLTNIKSCDDMIQLYEIVLDQLPLLEPQAKDILRSVIVISVSALDNFLHDFYRTEIVESYLGNGNFTLKFEKINVSIKAVMDIESSMSLEQKRNVFTQELKKIQKTDSYQSQKSIEYLFTNLGIKNIWSKLEQIGINVDSKAYTSTEIREELSVIIDRRNKISHESDWDFFHQRKFNIEKDDIDFVVKFIKELVKAFNHVS